MRRWWQPLLVVVPNAWDLGGSGFGARQHSWSRRISTGLVWVAVSARCVIVHARP
jgi:hypothetical protein